jgi:hypothetical protein
MKSAEACGWPATVLTDQILPKMDTLTQVLRAKYHQFQARRREDAMGACPVLYVTAEARPMAAMEI